MMQLERQEPSTPTLRSNTVIDTNRFEKYSLRKILNNEEHSGKIKTKIIVTIGPSCDSREIIEQFVEEGITLFRINAAHGTHEQMLSSIKIIHDIFRKMNHTRYSIIIDTEGCFPRTGHLNTPEIEFVTGDEVTLCVDHELPGNKEKLGCNIPNLTRCVRVGDKIYLNEGKIIGQVIAIGEDQVDIKILTPGTLGDNKKMFIPYARVKQNAVINQNDKALLSKLLALETPDGAFHFLSFNCQNCEDIFQVRSFLETVNQSSVRLLAKIWSFESIRNLKQIIKNVQGIIIARADLPAAVDNEKIFVTQKYITQEANHYGVPVITQSQMLDSMQQNIRPTRAEASDVANAVLDGTDCCCLSGETAVGMFPLESIKQMKNIIMEAENCDNSYQRFLQTSSSQNAQKLKFNEKGTASMAVGLSHKLSAQLIIVVTDSGQMARLVAMFRPQATILAVTYCILINP